MHVRINNQNVFDQTFGNQPGSTQSFRAPTVGPAMLGYDPRWLDSIYRNISVDFTVPVGDQIHITWYDGGLQGMSDESWGIDNISVTYQTVPAPGLAGFSALGLLGLRRRRRL